MLQIKTSEAESALAGQKDHCQRKFGDRLRIRLRRAAHGNAAIEHRLRQEIFDRAGGMGDQPETRHQRQFPRADIRTAPAGQKNIRPRQLLLY
ncbi:hypothetical protein D3C72_1625370 [compost metagenome]